MHPALSVIVFTVASGAGYGLAAALGLGLLDPAAPATKTAHIAALVLIAFGLISSTFHLGNPQRAWRALSQWRSSWLSREGVMAIATFVPLCLAAANAIFLGSYSLAIGVAGAAMCVVTVFCTAMIYASLRSVHAWHTPHTPACFLLFSAASGLALANVFALAGGANASPLLPLTALALGAAWIEKAVWRHRAKTAVGPSTAESATGLGEIGTVRLFEPPHMTPNYLTREMGYRVARRHAGKLWRAALLLGAAIPVATLLAIFLTGEVRSAAAASLAGLAAVSTMAGLLIERWLFFAEARHAVSEYYGI